jgi:hypothetical protein
MRASHACPIYRPDPSDFRSIPSPELAAAFARPHLSIVIDTEEEFDWGQPLARTNRRVRNLLCQEPAQRVFDAHGAVATYVIDHAVTEDLAAAAVMRRYRETGRAVVGAHLHPWLAPPTSEPLSPATSYAGNLPAELERAKLAHLTRAVDRAVGTPPRIYKAGRYGFGPATGGILADLGYKVDTSMVAHSRFTSDGGPDYTALDPSPRWLAGQPDLLELPTTAGFTGVARGMGSRTFDRVDGPWGRRLKVAGMLARGGILDRIRLTPEGTTLDEMRRLTDTLLDDGCRAFCLAYHSSSLLPGGSPYAKTSLDVDELVARLAGYCAYFLDELGGVAVSPLTVRDRLLAVRTGTLRAGGPDAVVPAGIG